MRAYATIGYAAATRGGVGRDMSPLNSLNKSITKYTLSIYELIFVMDLPCLHWYPPNAPNNKNCTEVHPIL